MSDYLNNCLDSGKACRQWIVDHTAGIPAGSNFETACNALTTCVGEFETLAGEAMAAGSEAFGATQVKTSEREDLIEVMEKNYNAASAAEPQHTGTQDRYYFRRNLSNEDLLAAAHSHVQGGNQDEDLLIDFGAPHTWVADTQAAADAFAATFGEKDSATSERIGKNAELRAKNNQLGQLKRTIGFFIKNYFAGDIAAQTSWKSAAHVKRPPSSNSGSGNPPTP